MRGKKRKVEVAYENEPPREEGRPKMLRTSVRVLARSLAASSSASASSSSSSAAVAGAAAASSSMPALESVLANAVYRPSARTTARRRATRSERPQRHSSSSSSSSSASSLSSAAAKPEGRVKVEQQQQQQQYRSALLESVPPQDTERAAKEPENWRALWSAVEQMRSRQVAPVDTMGCSEVGDKTASPRVFRFQTLVALMLSSMTKDETTAAAIAKMQNHWPDGLTLENVHAASEREIDSLICKVGFHNRKASYLKRTAEILVKQHNGDIPDTLKGLVALPGVGPKMAHLCLQAAWHKTVGIGVDIHVHRISNRFKWVRTNTPEQTREALEDWLPRPLWRPINKMLVGFGQTVCSALRPKCSDCLANELCPYGRSKLRHVRAAETRKKNAAKAKAEQNGEKNETKKKKKKQEAKGEASSKTAGTRRLRTRKAKK